MIAAEIIVSGGMTMPQVITSLGPAPHKNQGTRLIRMMTAWGLKYHQYIRYNLQLGDFHLVIYSVILDDALLSLL